MFMRPLMADIFDAVEESGAKKNGRTAFDDEIVIERDVVYKVVDGIELKMDIYHPTVPVAGAAVLDIPGGGWVIHNRARRQGYAKCFAALGATVFVIDHRLCPHECFFPYNLADCIDAYNFVVDNADKYGVNKDNITVTGDSSGGHLTACLGVAASNPAYLENMPVNALKTKPRSLILVSGAFSFKVMHRIPFTHTLMVRYATGQNTRSKYRKWQYNSQVEPYNYLTADFPTSYNSGGAYDLLCLGEAKRMAKKLTALGVKNDVTVGKNFFQGGHCYVLNISTAPARKGMQILIEWFAARLKEDGVDVDKIDGNLQRLETFFTQYKKCIAGEIKC